MACGYARAGVDLDAIFMARSSAKIADVGYRVAGVDISNRFEGRGGTLAVAAINMKSGGNDLANLFRDIGIPVVGAQIMVANYSSTTSPLTITWGNDGNWTKSGNVSGGANYAWLTAGAVASCELMITPTVGTFSSGTTGVWLPLTTSRVYTVTGAAPADKAVTFTAQIRHATTLTVLAVGTGIVLQKQAA